MSRGLGIEIEICLHQTGTEKIPYAVFRQITDAVNSVAYESEKRDLRAMQMEFPDLPNVAFDAAMHRLRKHRSSSVLINELRPGSLIVVASVAGLCIWVLQQTLGETLKEAWLESHGHERLKKFLLKRMGGKRHELATKTAQRIARKVPSETSISHNGPVDANSLEESSKIRIDVKIEICSKNYPPDRGGML